MTTGGAQRPTRLLLVQTQAEMAGAQEISRLLADGFAARLRCGEPEYDVHHLFFYRKTHAFDRWRNVHFVLEGSPKGPLSFARFLWRLAKTVQAIRPDVMLTFQHYGNIFGAPAGRLAGTPVIIANHVSAPATIGPLTRRIDRILGLAGAYDVITVNSNQTWREYQDYPERYRRLLAHVPHGFEDKSVDMPKPEARAAFGLPQGVPLAGSVARLHPLKQLDAAIRVLRVRPELHLAIAGQGPDEERLRALGQEIGVLDRLHFAGDLPPSRVGVFLAGLDVFVFPTLAETFGLAAVEAAQAGVPVVANDLPVLREVLAADGEECALFVEASRTEDFAAAIDRLLGDPALAARKIALGRMLAARYSTRNMVETYASLIRRASAPGGMAEAVAGPLAQRRSPGP